MFASVQRHGEADGGGQLPSPQAGAQRHAIRVQVAMLRAEAQDPVAGDANGRNRQVLKNLSAGGPGPLGQGLGDVNGVGVAVGGNAHAPQDIVDMQQRHPLLDGRRRQDLRLQAEHLGHGGVALQLLQPLPGGGDGHRTALPVAGGLPGFRLQALVKFPGVAGQAGHVDGAAQLAHQTGGMPGGA